jgi:GTPase SAR1 family protein
MKLTFIHPSNICVVGPSGSGKTVFVMKLISHQLIKPFPKQIYYLYNIWQDFMKDYPQIKFVQGMDLNVIENDDEDKLLIIDDLMLEMNKNLGEHFICRTRHLKCTTIFLMHTLFQNKDIHRLISNNTHYFVIFGNRRQVLNVKTLGNQLGMQSRVMEGYTYAMSQPFGYIVISLHPRVPESLTVTSDWFKKMPSVFV